MTPTPAPLPQLPGAGSRPAAYSLEGLAKAGEVRWQTIHFYVKKGILPRPKLAGPSTRYHDVHFVRLLATRAMQREKRKLKEIARWLDAASPEELVRAAGLPLPAPAPTAVTSDATAPMTSAATADTASQAATSAPSAPSAPSARIGPYRPAHARGRERFERVELCPGVELLIRLDADAEALRVAREIEATYAMPSA